MSTNRTITEIKQDLSNLTGFLTSCPHDDLKADFRNSAEDLGKEAWGLARSNLSLLDEAKGIQGEINEMLKPVKGAAPRRAASSLGEAVKGLDQNACRVYLSGLLWDGEARLSNPVYMQTVLGMDKQPDNSVKEWFINACARLAKPGHSMAPLVISGKRESIDALSKALAPVGAGDMFVTAARTLKPERATLVTIFEGMGKADKAHVLTDTADTFRRPRAPEARTEPRWWAPLVRTTSAPQGGAFIAVSAAPAIDVLTKDNAQIWAEAFYLFTESTKAQQDTGGKASGSASNKASGGKNKAAQ